MQIQTIDEVFAILDDEESPNITNWLGTLGTTGAAATSVLSTENSARSGRNSTNTTTLNNLKATLKTERSTAEAAADRLYRNTEQNSWNDYLTSVQSANTVYLGSIKTAENTYKTASDAADTAFDTTTITAYTNYHQSIHALDTAFYAAVAAADDPTFTTTAYFTTTGANPNLPYQKTALANTSKAVDHEDCPYCHGKGTKTVSTGGMGMVGLVYTGDPTSTVPCDHRSHTKRPAPEFAVVTPREFPPPASYFSQGNDLDPNKTQLSFIVVRKEALDWKAEKPSYGLAWICSWGSTKFIAADTPQAIVEQIQKELTSNSQIEKITFWGHGSSGQMFRGIRELGIKPICAENFTADGPFAPLLPYLSRNSLISFEGCNTFAMENGKIFAEKAAEYFKCKVGGYNAPIPIDFSEGEDGWYHLFDHWYAGYHILYPGQKAFWSGAFQECKKIK